MLDFRRFLAKELPTCRGRKALRPLQSDWVGLISEMTLCNWQSLQG
jgi:hypothetical protein